MGVKIAAKEPAFSCQEFGLFVIFVDVIVKKRRSLTDKFALTCASFHYKLTCCDMCALRFAISRFIFAVRRWVFR